MDDSAPVDLLVTGRFLFEPISGRWLITGYPVATVTARVPDPRRRTAGPAGARHRERRRARIASAMDRRDRGDARAPRRCGGPASPGRLDRIRYAVDRGPGRVASSRAPTTPAGSAPAMQVYAAHDDASLVAGTRGQAAAVHPVARQRRPPRSGRHASAFGLDPHHRRRPRDPPRVDPGVPAGFLRADPRPRHEQDQLGDVLGWAGAADPDARTAHRHPHRLLDADLVPRHREHGQRRRWPDRDRAVPDARLVLARELLAGTQASERQAGARVRPRSSRCARRRPRAFEGPGILLLSALAAFRDAFAKDPVAAFTWIKTGWSQIRSNLSVATLLQLALTASQVPTRDVNNVVVPATGGIVGGLSVGVPPSVRACDLRRHARRRRHRSPTRARDASLSHREHVDHVADVEHPLEHHEPGVQLPADPDASRTSPGPRPPRSGPRSCPLGSGAKG